MLPNGIVRDIEHFTHLSQRQLLNQLSQAGPLGPLHLPIGQPRARTQSSIAPLIEVLLRMTICAKQLADFKFDKNLLPTSGMRTTNLKGLRRRVPMVNVQRPGASRVPAANTVATQVLQDSPFETRLVNVGATRIATFPRVPPSGVVRVDAITSRTNQLHPSQYTGVLTPS